MLRNARFATRLIGAAVVSTLVFGTAIGADASTKKVKKHTRTVTLTYTGGCTVEVMASGNGGAASPGACSNFGGASYEMTAKAGEKYVAITVTDATGRAVPGQFWVKSSQLAHDTEVPFCGAQKDIALPSPDVLLDLDAVGIVANCPGVATSGTIKLVFSNLP